MSNSLTYTLKEVLEELDGYGLNIVSIDTVDEILSVMGLDLDTRVVSYDMEDD